VDHQEKEMASEAARKQRERTDRGKHVHSEMSRESQPGNQGGNRGEIDANKDRRQGGGRSNQGRKSEPEEGGPSKRDPNETWAARKEIEVSSGT
jgi:hypothetical protein